MKKPKQANDTKKARQARTGGLLGLVGFRKKAAESQPSPDGVIDAKKFAGKVVQRLDKTKVQPQQATGAIDPETKRRLSQYFKDGAIDNLRGKEMSERTEFLSLLASSLDVTVQLVDPPKKAPALWADRDKTLKESPAEFIARVYARYVGKGLTQAHIFDLDKSLYRAYTDLRPVGGKKPKGFTLPTKEEWNDILVNDPYLVMQLSPDARLKFFRAVSMRAQRSKGPA